METHRAFLALDISQDIKTKIMELEETVQRSGADVKLVEGENLHVTLKFLGEIGADSVEEIRKTMIGVKVAPFQLEAKGTGVFPNPRMARVLWVGVGKGSEETVSIFKQLDEGLSSLGFRKEREFTPHITIGRVRSGRGNAALMEALGAFRSTFFGSTIEEKIVLKRSQLTPSGPIYSNLLEVDLQP